MGERGLVGVYLAWPHLVAPAPAITSLNGPQCVIKAGAVGMQMYVASGCR